MVLCIPSLWSKKGTTSCWQLQTQGFSYGGSGSSALISSLSLALFKKYYYVRKKKKNNPVSHISSCSRTTQKLEYWVLSAIVTNYSLEKKKPTKQTPCTALRQSSITSQEQTTATHYHGIIYNTTEHYAYNKLHLILFLLNSDICKLMLFLFYFFCSVQYIFLYVS